MEYLHGSVMREGDVMTGGLRVPKLGLGVPVSGTYNFDMTGLFRTLGIAYFNDGIRVGSSRSIRASNDNCPFLTMGDIVVSGADSTDHHIYTKIDGNNVIDVCGTGDGSAGIVATKLAFHGATPQAQMGHIADPTDLATCISALTTLIAALTARGDMGA